MARRNMLILHINGLTIQLSYQQMSIEQSNHVYRQGDGSFAENVGEDRAVEITVTGAVPLSISAEKAGV